MKKYLKILRIVLVVFVILVVVVAVLVHLFADRAVKMGIEKGGTGALKVGVRVEDVDLSILRGRIGLKNLVIDNPPNYKHERLLELRDASAEVDIGSLLTDTVNIRSIKLEGVNLVLEQRGVSSNNLQDIIKSIPAADQEAQEPSGRKLHIDTLEISEITVNVKLLSLAPDIPLKLDPIKMTDLGGDNKMDVAALSGKILVALAGGIAKQGAGILPDEIIGPLSDQLKRLGALSGALLKKGGDVLKGGTDLGKGILEGGKDIGRGITGGLGGLLKRKEENPEDANK
ncbi:MAG TPA: AsmA family protein [Sedimentisphaerales bacterium]|nr:AsmA family protein [Sedimentisphaerales bacterium]